MYCMQSSRVCVPGWIRLAGKCQLLVYPESGCLGLKVGCCATLVNFVILRQDTALLALVLLHACVGMLHITHIYSCHISSMVKSHTTW